MAERNREFQDVLDCSRIEHKKVKFSKVRWLCRSIVLNYILNSAVKSLNSLIEEARRILALPFVRWSTEKLVSRMVLHPIQAFWGIEYVSCTNSVGVVGGTLPAPLLFPLQQLCIKAIRGSVALMHSWLFYVLATRAGEGNQPPRQRCCHAQFTNLPIQWIS